MQVEVDRFLRLPEALQLVGLGRSTFLREVKKGTYPKPLKTSTRTVAWSKNELMAAMKKLERGDG